VADRNPPSFSLSPLNETYKDQAEWLNTIKRGKRRKAAHFGKLKNTLTRIKPAGLGLAAKRRTNDAQGERSTN
jgi:hypothetical protein